MLTFDSNQLVREMYVVFHFNSCTTYKKATQESESAKTNFQNIILETTLASCVYRH